MPLPTPEELQAAWEEVQDLHLQYLAIHGVRLPQTEHYTGHNRALQLAVLCHYRHREVHKDEISAVAQRDLEDAAADQQVRHLKRDGWYIGPKPGLHKLDPYRVSQEFQNSNARKRKRLAGGDFDSIKQAFSGRCATCGALEGRPDPRYGDDIVKLQQGHRDPHEAGDDPDNIIPQCQFCNRSYRSDFVFDERGRVRAVAGIGPIQRASAVVQKRILDWLKRKFGEGVP